MARARVPGREVRGSRPDGRLMFMSLLAGMVEVGGRRHSQPGEVSEGTGRARLCAYVCTYVKHSTLNSAIEQELRDRRVEDRANATSSAYGGSVLVNPYIQKVRTKFIKKHIYKNMRFWTNPKAGDDQGLTTVA